MAPTALHTRELRCRARTRAESMVEAVRAAAAIAVAGERVVARTEVAVRAAEVKALEGSVRGAVAESAGGKAARERAVAA